MHNGVFCLLAGAYDIFSISTVFAGDAIDVAPDAYIDIRPGAGEEVSLQYLCHGFPVEVYLYDGANRIYVTGGPVTCMMGDGLPVTNDRWVQVKNAHTALQSIGWRGRYTKLALA